MDGVTKESAASGDTPSDRNGSPDFGFLPQNLRSQCRSLIESYHGLHGYGCSAEYPVEGEGSALSSKPTGSFASFSGKLRQPEAPRNPTRASRR